MDLGNEGNTVVAIGFAAIGAYYGGYDGMMLGASIANVLFRHEENKEHIPYNVSNKDTKTKTKADPVPVIVGTDLSTGTVVQLNNFEMVEGQEYHETIQDYADIITARSSSGILGEPVEVEINLLNVEFWASFAEEEGTVYNLWFDDFHFWLWMRFDDYIHEMYHHLQLGWEPVTLIGYNFDTWNPRPWFTECMYFGGILMRPNTTSVLVGRYHQTEDPIPAMLGGVPASFPNLKAEVGSHVAIGLNFDHTYRDNLAEYIYGIFNYTADSNSPYYNRRIDIRRSDIYDTYSNIGERLDTLENVFNNITRGSLSGQCISRQDINGNPDHLYVFQGRNWFEAGTYDHHHAEYSLEYDIFYIDRSDDTLHSVIYNNRISVQGIDRASESVPRIQIKSMEVTENDILLFGYEYQTHSPWDDKRVLNAPTVVSGRTTTLYADFSQYPNGYWANESIGNLSPLGNWVYFYNGASNFTYVERYRCIAQGPDYITVDGVYGLTPQVGDILYITRVRGAQASWGIVGAGSNQNVIYVRMPHPFDLNIVDGDWQYNAIQFENHQILTNNLGTPLWGWPIEIFPTSNQTYTALYLRTPLHEPPVIGERVWFSFHWGSYWVDEVEFRYEMDIGWDNPYNDLFWGNVANLASFRDIEDPQRYSCSGMHNRSGWGRTTVLRLDKATGELSQVGLRCPECSGQSFEEDGFGGRFNNPSYRYVGIQVIFTTESWEVSTASTDRQIFVSYQAIQPYGYSYNYQMIIDKPSLQIIDHLRERNFTGIRNEDDIVDYPTRPFEAGYGDWWDEIAYNRSHAAAKICRGCLRVRAYNNITGIFGYTWYALMVDYSPFVQMFRRLRWNPVTENYYLDYWIHVWPDVIGYYLMDLGEEGIFPRLDRRLNWGSEEFFYSGMENLEGSPENPIKWFRSQVATGPLYSHFFSSESTSRDSRMMRTYDYDNKLIFILDRGGLQTIKDEETWCFLMPSPRDPYGYYWPVSATNQSWVPGSGGWIDINYGCKYGLRVGSNSFSNFNDSKIHNAIYSVIGGAGLYPEDQEYADEIIEDIVIYNGLEQTIREPRYLYSKTLDVRRPKIDHISDVIATCQGFFVENCGYDLGHDMRVKLLKPDEPVEWYFGYHNETFITTSGSSNNRIFAAFTEYPENYWRGDWGRIEYNGLVYEFEITIQTTTYIELYSPLDFVPSSGMTFYLIKDNMIEKSFVYSKKSQLDKCNRVRVEFKNRLLGYKTDVVEIDDVYKQEIIDGYVSTRHLQLEGIKRATQAARMAARYLDYEQYINWMCSFRTDMIGFYLCVGDVIGVTNDLTGWLMKPFRIIKKDELNDHEVVLECEEYDSSLFHDYSIPVYQTSTGSTNGTMYTTASTTPEPPRRIHAFYDPIPNRIYVTCAPPYNSRGIMGIAIYVSVNGGTFERIGFTGTNSTSVYASEPIERTRTYFGDGGCLEPDYQYTVIPFDPSTLIGSFPASGYLWVNGELIYYGGIDTTNNQFVNCVREIQVYEQQYALNAMVPFQRSWERALIVLADSGAFYFSPNVSEIVNLALESTTEGGLYSYDIPEIDICGVSMGLSGIEGTLASSPVYRLELRYPLGRPNSVTSIQYSI